MTRDEWNALAAVEPVTPNQRSAIMCECERLGLVNDRAERLAVLTVLAGSGALGSTADLTMGQAGQVIGALRGVRDRDDLAALVAERQAAERQARQAAFAAALRKTAFMIYESWRWIEEKRSGEIPAPASGRLDWRGL